MNVCLDLDGVTGFVLQIIETISAGDGKPWMKMNRFVA
jgi:hypothetical protein